MPLQGGPLSSQQVEVIRRWIENGAPWVQPEQWWSLKPPTKPDVPRSDSSWVRNPIDAFVLAKLQEKGLQHSPEADRRTLIRRLTYDLHGLPPSPEETDAFVADDSPGAYEKLVDRSVGISAIRRAMGPSLAGRRPLWRIAWIRQGQTSPECVAVSRLCDPVV